VRPGRASEAPNLTLVRGSKAKGAGMLLEDKKTKANPAVMRRAAKVLGINTPKATGAAADQELLGKLRMEIAKRTATLTQEQMFECVECKEISTDDTEFCPFCGDEGVSSDENIAEVVGAVPANARQATSIPPPKKSSKPAAAEVEEVEKVEEVEAVVVTPPTKRRGVGITRTPVPVVVDVDARLAEVEQELEAVLQRLDVLKNSAVGMSYDVGLELKKIRDQQLFKARGYTTFKDFALNELPMKRESALHLCSIVDTWSREDYLQMGYSKIRLITAITDPVVKEELIAAAKGGATRAELTERAMRGSTPPPNKPAVEKGEKITLLGKIGARKQAVKFHDASTGEVLDHAGTFKNYKPEIYGELEISDGVFVRFGLRVNGSNQLEGLTVKFVRAGDGAE